MAEGCPCSPQGELGLDIVEEAADGLEAVQKAQATQPDLVVLDIGLPTLNGIEVAPHIRRVSVESKVVFLTENHSCDVKATALQDGASGYVLKSAFARELIPVLEAVIEMKNVCPAQIFHGSPVAKSPKEWTILASPPE